MNKGGDPFGSNKTVILPTPGGVPRRDGASIQPLPELRGAPQPNAAPNANATVVAPMPGPPRPLPASGQNAFPGVPNSPFGAQATPGGDPFSPLPHGFGAAPAGLVRPPGVAGPSSPAAASPFGLPPPTPDDWMRGAPAPVAPAFSQPAAPPRPAERIPLEAALNARDGTDFSAANPVTAAAAPLLVLLGRLRLQIVDMQAKPLMEHVFRSVTEFDRRVRAGGLSDEDARTAVYALCALADDIVQNLPGSDRHVWMQYSMLAQFFGVRNSGNGFFDALGGVMANPGPRYDLLELMHACLCLGFEGRYRGAEGGEATLQRVRRDVYQTLRSLRARSDDEISPHWRGLSLRMRDLASRVPVWSVAAVLAMALAGVFFFLRFLLAGDGGALEDRLLALHPPEGIAIARAAAAEPFAAAPESTTQLERIRAELAPEIKAGGMAVELAGTDFITIRVSNLVLFDSGKAVVKPQFGRAAARIAAALNREPGPIAIIGHTDNVKPRRTSRFKDNKALSVARAQAVEAVLAKSLTAPARVAVSGKGETAPLRGNKTPEQRAENRRVEIMLRREETL